MRMTLDSQIIFGPETLEQFPSKEEIESVFGLVCEGRTYAELKIESDEKGISRYEVEVALEDGEKAELNFQRAKNNYLDKTLPPDGQFCASIHATYYDKDGMPYTGEPVANYSAGKWEWVSQALKVIATENLE